MNYANLVNGKSNGQIADAHLDLLASVLLEESNHDGGALLLGSGGTIIVLIIIIFLIVLLLEHHLNLRVDPEGVYRKIKRKTF